MIQTRSERIVERILPSVQDLVFLVVFAGVFIFGPRMMNIDGDLGRHITIGNYILSTGRIPTHDLFSHTMTGEPLTPHEWLAQVFFAALYEVGGLNAVVWGCAVILSISFVILFNICWRQSGNILVAATIIFLGIFASSIHWLTRPHLFTLLFFTIWLDVLYKMQAGRQKQWFLLPLVMLLWVNTHGAFIAGLLSLMIMFFGILWERWIFKTQITISYRPWLLALTGSIIMTGFNPVGWGILETSFGYVQNRYLVGHTAEYLPPNFHDPSTWPFLIMTIVMVLLLGFQNDKQKGGMLFLAAAWTGMALYSTRNIPLFVIAASPVIVIAASDLLKLPFFDRLTGLETQISSIQNRLRGWFLPLLLLVFSAVLIVYSPTVFNDRNRFKEDIFPVQAVNWLEDHPQQGNVFNYFPWGGYLLYRLWPEVPVFIDGQTDFYGEEFTRKYEQVLTMQEGWREVFLAYDVSWVIMPIESRLFQTLNTDDHWQILYQDETAVILSRSIK